MRSSHRLADFIERVANAPTLDELRRLRIEVWHEPEEFLPHADRRLLFELLTGRHCELLGSATPDPRTP